MLLWLHSGKIHFRESERVACFINRTVFSNTFRSISALTNNFTYLVQPKQSDIDSKMNHTSLPLFVEHNSATSGNIDLKSHLAKMAGRVDIDGQGCILATNDEISPESDSFREIHFPTTDTPGKIHKSSSTLTSSGRLQDGLLLRGSILWIIKSLSISRLSTDYFSMGKCLFWTFKYHQVWNKSQFPKVNIDQI